ncbi:MAG TPA: type II secretion system protein [Burkholderiales bacterium]|nr:type II secretion system protein [Burkholderiales bacterium]
MNATDCGTHAQEYRQRADTCEGFTYITVLFLIAVMGIVLSVVGEMWHTVQKREKETELLFVGAEFRRALTQYNASAPGYPQRLEDLLKDPRFPDVRRYLRKIYRDPLTGRAEWGLLKSPENAITGVYSLSDEEPLKQAGFSAADAAFEGKKKYSEWVFFSRAAQVKPGVRAPSPGATQGITGLQPSAAQPLTSK